MSAATRTMAAAKEPIVQVFTPEYGEEAGKHLGNKDRGLKRLIPRFGDVRLASRGDAITTQARRIVGPKPANESMVNDMTRPT